MLKLEHIDGQLREFRGLAAVTPPEKGWIHSIRKAMGMSLRQLGERLGTSAQSARGFETREANRSITLSSLQQVADALNMKVVYGLVPKEESIEKIVEQRAYELAEQIVGRAAQTMVLEDQAVSYERNKSSIEETAEHLKRELPRYLWD